MFDLTAYTERRLALVEDTLRRLMPPETERPAAFHQAMRYPVFAGGKRLRPMLCLAACETVGGTAAQALTPAAALEILHTYTLVHDDLPCMDNDDLRRGRPTAHIVYGEAKALLAGDALLTLAFEWLAGCVPGTNWTTGDLVRDLAHAAGSYGVIGGQVEDLDAEGADPDPVRVEYIHRHKTAALIRAAVRLGGMCGGASHRELAALSAYGESTGLAFQIADDILNETSTPGELGKATGSDRQHRKTTYVSVFGLESAKARATALVAAALHSLESFGDKAEALRAMARYSVERRH